MTRARAALCAALIVCPSIVAFAAGPVVVNQIRRAFSVRDIHIQKGETIRFNNIDEFLHQLYIDSRTFKFSSPEQSPGQVVDVTFPTAGTFEVRCEIHPKMLLNVTVE
jgi:plastocyanin